jgi:UDP-N-acetylmuramate--alanine ligase
MKLDDIAKIYFVGIGGIGMSALARYFHRQGAEVHGYDKTETTLTRTLVEEGMLIHYEEDLDKIPEGVDLVVYTPAVPAEHRELEYFRSHHFPVKKRAEVLGLISRDRKTVAIAGTHGKTTTSSMLTYLLRSGGIDCTAFLGGIARNFDSNVVTGDSEWVVVEADEYDRSFLHLSPDIAVILSMEPDHLDIYGDAESILETGFKAFAGKRKPGGELLVNHRIAEHFSGWTAVEDYGLEAGRHRADHIRVEDGFFVFDYHSPEQSMEQLQLAMPGRHNVENATAAVAVALKLGIKPPDIRKGLATFQGIKRRFEVVYRDAARVYIDDYAHHPSELKAAIGAARELFPERRITGVFQPHLYSRTRDFAEGFAGALDQLDEIILLDIYPAREKPIPGVTARIIYERMCNPNRMMTEKEELIAVLKERKPEVLLTLGAGDIDTCVQPIAELMEQLKEKDR